MSLVFDHGELWAALVKSVWAPTCPPTEPRLKALSRHWKSMTSPGVASACGYIQALRMSDRFGEDSALKSYCYFPQALEPVVQT